jgi:hypothetical protein
LINAAWVFGREYSLKLKKQLKLKPKSWNRSNKRELKREDVRRRLKLNANSPKI